MHELGGIGARVLIDIGISIYSPIAMAIAVFMYYYSLPTKTRLIRATSSLVLGFFGLVILAKLIGIQYGGWVLIIAVTSTVIAIGNTYHAFKHKF